MKSGTPIKDLGKRPLIMGIVNVTPDSFSGDGLLLSKNYVDDALAYALDQAANGAEILDIGGESSRPGAQIVGPEEEIRRTAPIIAAIRKKLPEMPISVDTIKPAVAAAAIEAGATIVNDISGSSQDPALRALVAKHGTYLIQMHNAAQPSAVLQTQTIGGEYLAQEDEDICATVARELAALAGLALESGIERDRIILDPGVGFGKTPEQNLQLVAHLDRFAPLGFPLLLGASRKSFIGRVLDLPPEERLEGTAAVTAIAAFHCPAIMRVHDVKAMARVAKMAWALARA